MRLHRHLQVDRIRSEERAKRGRWGRWVYLAILLAFFGWLGHLFFGSVLFFRSEGMVLARVATVATEFSATVRQLVPREGDRVSAGEIVARVTSQEVVERIAQLSSQMADLQSRKSALDVRAQVVDRLREVAKGRADVTEEARKKLDRLNEREYLLTRDRLAIYESEYQSKKDTESLEAERRAISAESHILLERMNDASTSLSDLKKLYANGEVRAPISGVVGRLYVSAGSVVRLGDPMMDIYDDTRYVLAYVPAGAIYDVLPGDPVSIRYGLSEWRGVVERVEPVAPQLPKEFQRTFQPVERARVLRIAVTSSEGLPPLFSKITVEAADWPPGWLLRMVPWIEPWLRGRD